MDLWTWPGIGVLLGVMGSAWWLPSGEVVAGAFLVAVAALLRTGWYRGFGCVAGVCLGLGAVASQPSGPWVRGPGVLEGTVVSRAGSREADVWVTRWTPMGGTAQRVSGRVRVGRWHAPSVGSVVVVMGRAGPLWARGLPGGPDAVWNARRGRLRSQVRAWTATVIGPERAEPRPIHGLLDALATGRRAGVSAEALSRLRRTGTAHLLAISGFHVGLVAAMCAGVMRLLLGVAGLWRTSGLPRTAVAMASVAAAWWFAWVVGAPVSAQRAGGAVGLVAFGMTTGRRVHAPAVVAAVGTGVLIADPVAIGGPSFQLSFGAVVGLIGWGSALARWVPPDLPRVVDHTLKGVVATVAATVGTFPAAAWWFQAVAPLGPAANVVAMPWTAFVLVPCAMAAAYGPPGVWQIANGVGGVAADGLVHVLGWFDVAPWQPAVGALGALALVAVLGMASRKRLAMAWVALCLLRPCDARHPTRITWPDVGQGSSALVEFADGRVWLVDGGSPWSRIASWLRRRRIHHIDVVVASHGDADHVGGLLDVVDTMSVGALHVVRDAPGVGPLVALAEARGVPVVDDPRTRLHPASSDGWSSNDGSVVLRIDASARVVLPGDVGIGVETALAPAVGPVDVAVLGHHGSRTSTGRTWLDALTPRLAVVQAGRHNVYGHPHAGVRARLLQRGVPLLRTDLHGTVQITFGETWVVRSHRVGVGWQVLTPLAAPPDRHAIARRRRSR